ncbi:MAG: protein jag [Clostridia bacterium]|nr:protein jag [Clostridia bacterium]
MSVSIEKTAKTVQQAIQEALDELGLDEDAVVIEVLDEGETGLLGLLRRPARVRVTVEDEMPEEKEPEADQELSETSTLYYGDDESYTGDPETEEETRTVSYVASILSGIGIHGKISSWRDGETLYIDVTGHDCGAAIGRRGETLEAIQYLASLVANQNSEEYLRVIVDIAGYRKKRETSLINLAEKAASKVSNSGRKMNLEPMNPAERRIIHTALQTFPGVTTYSEGENEERHVVIAPDEKD